MDGPRYWIGVVGSDHAAAAVAGGYAQLNHGKAGALERMRAGDGFAFYSPRTTHPDGDPVQAFTAMGRIRAADIYQADAGAGFRPFRIAVDYFPASAAPIRPLLDGLSFIRSRTHWGAAFRYGVVRVPEADFARIATAMACAFPFPAATPG
jgi:hypothetical protein